MIRTRFAPSPTGSLHVGNARIAVLNWLLTRQNDGVFILRIEDTDTERNEAGAEAGITEDLRWLGLDWDEGPGAGSEGFPGPNAPYHQSERLKIYREYGDWLRAAGLAYPCFCSTEQLADQRDRAITAGEPAHYPGTCRGLDADDVRRLEREGKPFAIRFRVPDGEAVEFRDAVYGTIRVEREEIGDFVLIRSDGRPTYNFAVVVDDALMEVTHVIRGAGHLSNTPRQVLLFEALNHTQPIFAHVPTVLGEDRQKLSKRHGAQSLAELRAEGYHPDAVINYLSLLAWSSPSGDEVLTRDRLVSEISLDRLRAADTVFDPAKLRWLSAQHIEAMPLDALVAAVRPYVPAGDALITPGVLPSLVAAVRTHLATFADIETQLEPFRTAADRTAEDARAAAPREPDERTLLVAARRHLGELERWDEEAIGGAIRQAGKDAHAKGPALYTPIRQVVTGAQHGPPLVAMLRVLGQHHVLGLLDAALERRPAD